MWINTRSETSTGHFPSPPLRIRSDQQRRGKKKSTQEISSNRNQTECRSLPESHKPSFRRLSTAAHRIRLFRVPSRVALAPVGGLAGQITNLNQKTRQTDKFESSLLERMIHWDFPHCRTRRSAALESNYFLHHR